MSGLMLLAVGEMNAAPGPFCMSRAARFLAGIFWNWDRFGLRCDRSLKSRRLR
jgi:hypothetical protein